MAAVLNIITALGIDSSLWYQLTIFIVTFFALKQIVFVPYFAAYESRQGQTHGYHAKAEQIFAQTRELEMHYQRKARGLTAEIKAIYDNAKQDALKEHEQIHAAAAQKAREILESSRERIHSECGRVRDELAKQVPDIGQTIMAQLIKAQKTPQEKN